MTSPPDRQTREPRASIRIDARLDAMTRAKVDDLATHFHQPRAAVLSHIMHWGLNHGQPVPLDHDASPGPVRHLYLKVDAALQKKVAKAVAATGGDHRGMGAPDGAPDRTEGFPRELAGGTSGGAVA